MFTHRFIPSLLAAIVIGSSFCAPALRAEQPRMEAALVDLESARAKLEHAVPDKGGHRERALELVNQAIAQIKEGVRFANHH